jgi:hypothetical protein
VANVVFTIVVLAAVLAWGVAVYNRLLRLRDRVNKAWQLLEPDPSNDSARTVYNRHVAEYNHALEGFPANVVAMAAGLKPARRFQ